MLLVARGYIFLLQAHIIYYYVPSNEFIVGHSLANLKSLCWLVCIKTTKCVFSKDIDAYVLYRYG